MVSNVKGKNFSQSVFIILNMTTLTYQCQLECEIYWRLCFTKETEVVSQNTWKLRDEDEGKCHISYCHKTFDGKQSKPRSGSSYTVCSDISVHIIYDQYHNKTILILINDNVILTCRNFKLCFMRYSMQLSAIWMMTNCSHHSYMVKTT